MIEYLIQQVAYTYIAYQSGFFMTNFRAINDYLEAKVYLL